MKALLAIPGVDILSKDKNGRTPFSYAASSSDYLWRNDAGMIKILSGVIKLFLSSANVNADSKDSHGRTPLSYAAEHGCTQTVKCLIARSDVDVHSIDKDGRNPLSYAAGVDICAERMWFDPRSESVRCSGVIVGSLLSIPGIEIDTRDKRGRSPLSYALERGNSHSVPLLLARTPQYEPSVMSHIHLPQGRRVCHLPPAI